MIELEVIKLNSAQSNVRIFFGLSVFLSVF